LFLNPVSGIQILNVFNSINLLPERSISMSKGGASMGSIGMSGDANVEKRFSWVKDVSTDRLRKYIMRSGYLVGKDDPQGRSIHTVGAYAARELLERTK
jgi:hypothetical protein